MSIDPIITFKAGACDLDVSYPSPGVMASFIHSRDDPIPKDSNLYRTPQDPTKSLLNPLPAIYTSTRKMIFPTSAGDLDPHP